MSWYETGFDGVDKEQSRVESKFGPDRFWVPPESSRELIFVDDEPFQINEHNPKINGGYKNWFTCLRGVHDEVVCCEKLGGDSRYYVGYMTVVDCSEWTDKRGITHKYEVKLLPAKLRTMKKIRRKKEERGSLVGCLYRSSREDRRSAAVGDEFEFQREVDMEKLFEHAMYKGKSISDMFSDSTNKSRLDGTFQMSCDDDGNFVKRIVPFNYFEVLKPREPAFIKDMLYGVGDSDGASYGADDGVPF